jgi:hypothetical protein
VRLNPDGDLNLACLVPPSRETYYYCESIEPAFWPLVGAGGWDTDINQYLVNKYVGVGGIQISASI